jgi:8-oxo-dGTP pyrophosphatase MutT (NUDIX family)
VKADIATPRPAAAKKRTGVQYAALPYRVLENRVEILLITSRRTRRWIVPKGWPIEGLPPPDCAALEALEEAGVGGEIQKRPIGHYRYLKHSKKRPSIPCKVEVFACKVTHQRKTWAEKAERERRWCSVEDAAASVSELQLQVLILEFGARMIAGLHAETRSHKSV